MDWYTVLSIDRSATDAQIRNAYRRAVLRHHPDKTLDVTTGDSFGLVTEAYRVLIDPQQRAAYDASQGSRAAKAAAQRRDEIAKERLRAELERAEQDGAQTSAEDDAQATARAEKLAALRAENKMRREALDQLRYATWERRPEFRTVKDGPTFETIDEARAYIDGTSEDILVESRPERKWSAALESSTLGRLPA